GKRPAGIRTKSRGNWTPSWTVSSRGGVSRRGAGLGVSIAGAGATVPGFFPGTPAVGDGVDGAFSVKTRPRTRTVTASAATTGQRPPDFRPGGRDSPTERAADGDSEIGSGAVSSGCDGSSGATVAAGGSSCPRSFRRMNSRRTPCSGDWTLRTGGTQA